jgi:hypothetical protein
LFSFLNLPGDYAGYFGVFFLGCITSYLFILFYDIGGFLIDFVIDLINSWRRKENLKEIDKNDRF